MKEFVLITSGTVDQNKRNEFEQTVKFILNHVSSGCVRRDFSIDVNVSGRYHLLLGWDSLDALDAFKQSNELTLLQGALDTLGGSPEFLQGTIVNSFTSTEKKYPSWNNP
jgi:quinol monooxygenase YgiN